jgi:tetraprenyl-beta-curcumene synthase
VAKEVQAWRRLSQTIPSQEIRADALNALNSKRGQVEGAALFSILPRARNLPLLRLLVAYQLIWDFLDCVHERAPTLKNGAQLHQALIDALEPNRPHSDYYLFHPWRDDGGYLRALVDMCRNACQRLPLYVQVKPRLMQEAWRAQILPVNHLPPVDRDAKLRDWAASEFPLHEAEWFELTGAASAGLTIFALLTLAAESASPQNIERVQNAYFPWLSTAATMLDSYVDQTEDRRRCQHVYIDHYANPDTRADLICELMYRCFREANSLDRKEHHVLILASMTAMYLSKDSARAPLSRTDTQAIVSAGGSLTRLLLPVLRTWRIIYRQRDLT